MFKILFVVLIFSLFYCHNLVVILVFIPMAIPEVSRRRFISD